MLIRRKDLPRINKGKGSGNPGLVNGHLHLPDEWKWRIRHYVNAQQVPPPSGSTRRVSRFANARFLLGTAIESVEVKPDGALLLQTNRGPLELDFLFFSTGFKIDWSLRREFKDIARTSSTGATATPRRPVKKTRNWPTRPTWARCSSSSRRRRAACRDWSVSTASATGRRQPWHGVRRHPGHQRWRLPPGAGHRRADVQRGHRLPLPQYPGL
jgi:hypothetical protein